MSFALPESVWEMVEPLGWVLVHFVWQGILVGIGLALFLAAMRQGSAKGRYCASLVALGGMGAMPFVTLAIPALSRPFPEQQRVTVRSGNPSVEVTEPFTPSQERAENEVVLDDFGRESELTTSRVGMAEAAGMVTAIPTEIKMKSVSLMERMAETVARLRSWLKLAVVCWLAGVLALSFRLLRMWNRVQQLRCVGVDEVGDQLVSRLEELARKVGLRMRVNLLLSRLVEVPTLIGWMRPVILLPATAVTGLTPAQLDAILVHELAHIQRHDYLVNLMQSAMETLLFYHPAVWWVSARLRVERENCCDDLTVEILGDPINYGRALLVLEEQRGSGANPALVLGSQGGSLLGRIERLVARSNEKRRSTMGTSISVLVGMLLVSCATMLMVHGEIAKEKSIEITADEGERENENDGEIPEQIVHRFEMIFFQDQERRTIPAVTFQLGDKFYAVISASATIPSDGVEHAIDRMFMRFHNGIDYKPRYQKKESTKEIFVYQTSSLLNEIPSLRPDQVTELAVGDRVSVVEIRGEKEIVQTIDAARVSGVGKNTKIVYHDGKDSHLFENLTEINKRYPEGTAVFSNGKLGGFVVAGERFLPQGENRSLIVPADRIVSAIQSLLGPNRQERAGQTLAEDRTDDEVVMRMTPVPEQMMNLLLDGEISLNLDGVPLEQGLREIFGEGQIQIEFDKDSLQQAMISTKHPVTIQLEKVRRRTALRLMLEQVRLTWDVRDGMLQITTPEAMSHRLLVKSYSVSDLLQPDKPKSVESLIELLTQTIEPGSWDENGGTGRVEFDPRSESLVVRQVSSLHTEIESCLSQLRSLVFLNRSITISFEAIPLREAIDRLSKLSGMRLYLDPLGLDEVGVKPDVPVTLDAKDLRFHAALMQILEPLHLAYRKEAADEIVRITSTSRAKGKISTRTYEGFGNLQELKEVIVKTIDPESWDQVGGEGRIEPVELTRTLVIRQSDDAHDQIRKVLDELLREKLQSLPQGPYLENE